MSSNGRIGGARFNNPVEDLNKIFEAAFRGGDGGKPQDLTQNQVDQTAPFIPSGARDTLQQQVDKNQAEADKRAEQAARQERIKNILEAGAKQRIVAPGISQTLINPISDNSNPNNTLITLMRR